MKKILAALMALTLLLTACLALADGATTDKPITFAEFNFGDTFESIRSGQFMRNAEFKLGKYSPRVLADAFTHMGDWMKKDDTTPLCFASSPDGGRNVAGHDAQLSLWFVYPVESGESVRSEADATFYAGEYDFWDGDAKAIYDDLKQKLTQLYGEPYTVASSVDAVFGAVELPAGFEESYAEHIQRYEPTYAVWKSTANNAALVLKFYNQDGQFLRTKLSYISLDAQAVFDQISMSGSAGGGSLQGL